MKILLPDNTPLDPDLPPGVEAVRYSPSKPVPPEHHDAEILVSWGQSGSGSLADTAQALTRLRWVQSLAAGPDAVLAAGFADDVIITSGRGLHDRTVAEHALALTLAGLRRFPELAEARREHRWAREVGGVQALHPADRVTTLLGAHVLIWGFGGIGRTLARYLDALGAHVRGVARSAGERDGFPVVAEDDVDEELRNADVLVLILPSSPDTDHVLDAERLALLPSRAWVINVGRGSTVNEAALVAALEAGTLGGAGLDVFETEPLPADSPLWDAPNVIISPHSAGGRPVGVDELLSENLAAFVAGKPLRNVIER
ncbi:phosphoglycerate dehydrogenase [Georgenia faecalis]|uniref:Phosphoglycerate dehydrogenase n=1 Tax=Georgenia faecalis TaxID=2483799 RepID=A0ABV9D5I4_9MICO|nr:phosphoglycerate dehydrogenase [Georgenia faecalis]